VLSDVGCNLPEADNHDQRMVAETLTGTTSTQGFHTHKKGLIDRESDAEGFDGLNIETAARPADWDTDGDGMPDWWETAYGTDPHTPDNNGDLDGNHYTNLEEYLNWMAEPHFSIQALPRLTWLLISGVHPSCLYRGGRTRRCYGCGRWLTPRRDACGIYCPHHRQGEGFAGDVSLVRSFHFYVSPGTGEC
jgi:hypothetical protein